MADNPVVGTSSLLAPSTRETASGLQPMSRHDYRRQSTHGLRYVITDIRCLPFKYGVIRQVLNMPPFLCIKISINGELKETSALRASNEGSYIWPESFRFDVEEVQRSVLYLYQKHRGRKEDSIGETEIQISGLSNPGRHDMQYGLKSYSEGVTRDTQYVIHFTIECVENKPSTGAMTDLDSRVDEMSESIGAAAEAMSKLHVGPPLLTHGIDIVSSGSDQITNIAPALDSILKNFNALLPILNGIAEIHPYAQVAWSILTVIPKTIKGQADRDSHIVDLVDTMKDTFTFVHDALPLGEYMSFQSDSRLQILSKIIEQTTECAYFICNYAKDTNFGIRLLKNIWGTDGTIAKFRETLERLTKQFESRANVKEAIDVIHIRMLTERLGETMDYLAEGAAFSDMYYAKGAGYQIDKICLPETRIPVITEIVDWVNAPDDDSGARVLWLSGLAGTGKSTIAHTVAGRFAVNQRLGSFFAFDVTRLAERNPTHLFSNIAIDLTSLDTEWRHSLWKIVKDNPALRNNVSIPMQFSSLLLEPLQSSKFSLVGPIVIVIDALDESEGGDGRKHILSILGKTIVKLPSNFRFIVTSRREKDIHAALDGKPHVKQMHMEDIKDTTADIDLYIKDQIGSSPSVMLELDTHSNKMWCSHLVRKSEGLFQWAATACRFITEPPFGSTSSEQFDAILSFSSNLDSLYFGILKRAMRGADSNATERFRCIMGILLQLKEPLPMSGLAALCPEGYTYAIVDAVLGHLGSLFTGIGQKEVPVQPLHTSFRDFLTKDKVVGVELELDNPFAVDVSSQNSNIAVACLRAMKCLKFNVCRMKTSHVRNVDDPALPARIKQYILPQLSYSCRFWAAHLKAARCDADIIHMVHETLYIRFLYWLEVLSSISAFNGVSESLSFVKAWGENPVSDGRSKTTEKLRKEISVFVEDALQFIGVFGAPISQSAPHIYLSALPSAPTTSIVSQTFLPQFKNVFIYETGERQYWPACQNTFRVPADIYSPGVNVIGLPDAKRFISTFSNSVIHRTKCFIWDVETCSILNELEHSSGIESVAVSQNSEYLVSASRDTICVWNLGSMVVEVRIELAPDDATETRIVAISPDGTCVALAKCFESPESGIFVWNARTGRVIAGPFITKDSTALIAFSSDNSILYSVTSRDPVCVTVWDVESGSSEVHQLEGAHDSAQIHYYYDPVLACSPDRVDGRRLAFYSYIHDQILIYNIEEHNFSFNVKTRLGPVGNIYDDQFYCLAFSQDGRRIVSSWRSRFRVWDACTGDMIAGPFEGDGLISSLAFLGEHRIISASPDATIQIWNTANEVHPEPYDEVLKIIYSVDFSPSGEHIVSTGGEKTIRLWNAKTGRACRTHLYIEASKITFAAFTPDGKHIVTVSPGEIHQIVRIWNTTDNSMGPVSIRIEQKYSRYLKPKISPDSKSVAAVSQSPPNFRYTLGLWDTTTGNPHQASLKFPFTSEWEDKYMHFWDGKLVACTGRSADDLYIYDTEKGTITTKKCEGRSHLVTLSQDHRHVAAYVYNSSDNIRIWDMETGKDSGLLRMESRVECLVFSPNSRFLVSASDEEDGTLLVWDVKSNLAVKPLALRGHTGAVRSVAFSRDSRYIVSGGEDNLIRVWDVSDLGNDNGERPIAEGLPEFGDDDYLVDGWVRGPDGELLFLVPTWNRVGLARPRNTVVIGKGANKLNFTRFVHGEDWWKCYTGVSG